MRLIYRWRTLPTHCKRRLPVRRAGGGSIIDILVAYTPAVETVYGSAEAVDALIIQAVAEANQAYSNSQMTTRLNLVLTTRTGYTESGSMSTDVTRLRSTSDGYMDELHALRDAYGADVVSLIEDEPQYCGIAYRMTTLSAGFESSAFNVVHHACATGYYSFAHEIGHNQGAHHDYANTGAARCSPMPSAIRIRIVCFVLSWLIIVLAGVPGRSFSPVRTTP